MRKLVITAPKEGVKAGSLCKKLHFDFGLPLPESISMVSQKIMRGETVSIPIVDSGNAERLLNEVLLLNVEAHLEDFPDT